MCQVGCKSLLTNLVNVNYCQEEERRLVKDDRVKKHKEDGHGREDRKHRRTEDNAMGGKSEKLGRRRHSKDRDRTGTESERRKKSDKDGDLDRRDRRQDDARESHSSRKVNCAHCFPSTILCLHFLLASISDLSIVAEKLFILHCYWSSFM